MRAQRVSPGFGTRATEDTAAPPDGALVVQQGDELGALALRQAADRLARGDAAVGEDLVDLHAAVLGYREQHVEHLRRLDVLGRIEQQRVDRAASRLEV